MNNACGDVKDGMEEGRVEEWSGVKLAMVWENETFRKVM